MADAKISALTALTGANIATDDELPIVDTSVTTTKKTTMADLSSRTETMTNKTLTLPVLGGTPAAAGVVGYDTTQKMVNAYGGATAIAARIHQTISVGVTSESLTNSTASDQDFTSFYTFPANAIYTNKVYRVTVFAELTTGTSSVTFIHYLKIGSTKVYTSFSANVADGQTRGYGASFLILGTAAAGAAAAVTTECITPNPNSSYQNTVAQPVNLATNGTLTINFGVTWSGTGSTETLKHLGYLVEELN